MNGGVAAKGAELPRTLSSLDVGVVLVAVTIGAGIYSTPQLIARHLGDLSTILACWLVGGAFAWLGVLIYAEVGTRIPETGGEYLYLRRAFGPWAGFLVGWVEFFLVAPSARVGLGLVAANYLTPVSAGGATRVAVAAALIVALCAVNYVGVRPSLAAQKALVILKVVGLGALIVGAFWREAAASDTAAAPAQYPGGGALAAAMLMILFSYLGWQHIGSVAGEMHRPRRALSIGALAGMALVVLLYIGTVASYHRALGARAVAASPSVAADTAAAVFGPAGGWFLAALVVVSILGSMTGSIMAHSRLCFAVARDGLFFRAFDFVHPRFATPSRAILAHGVACLVLLALRQSLEVTFAAMAFGRLVFMALVGVALFRLRRAARPAPDVFLVPLYPLLPAIFLAGVLLLIVARVVVQPRDTLVDLVILLGALPLLPIARWLGRRTEVGVVSSTDR